MSKTVLLAAASIIALCAGASAASALSLTNSGQALSFKIPKNAKLLWNQNSNDAGNWVNSQTYTGGESSAYNDQGADDFVIPKGRTWRITEVDVTGQYYASGPASSENVIFYRNKDGMPGKPVRNGTFSNLNGAGGPNFAIVLPGKGVKLRAGHYWVSVVANQNFQSNGQWLWEVNSVQHENQAMWENPPDGYDDCPTWGTLKSCLDTGPDLMFDLRGMSQVK